MSLESVTVVDEDYKFENEFNKSAVHFSPLLEASGSGLHLLRLPLHTPTFH